MFSQDLLADSNPMVVANAVAALAEIQEVSGRDVFQITSQSLFKLLRALNECTEWGQVSMLLFIGPPKVMVKPTDLIRHTAANLLEVILEHTSSFRHMCSICVLSCIVTPRFAPIFKTCSSNP